ncbi:TonB-dependent receptor [Paludibaculum fermentans]|uniref:TonB-dependent receptor n=1 Tax=Paludibaculum fermentans TaxID=1473598 RepID=A0A7S7NL97_PALFE|nr:carboxypeptidase regulatory-like domain-containing protein [Paludibaculum fermentans]QOY85639.1 TonB-dependent receptor [Paludibaculum fermentans]
MKQIFLMLFVCLYSAGAWAQSVVGSGVVRGRVVDQQGVGMPGAELSLENPAMGVTRTFLSTDDGVFEITGLPPATGYRLRATHERYLDWDGKEFEVLAGKQSSFDISMRPQDSTAASADAPADVQLDGSVLPVGVALSQRQLQLLPTQQRRWDSLVLLSPVTTFDLAQNALAIRGDSAGNAYFTDGILTSNSYSARRSVATGPVSQDAVQGIEVLAADAPVEFGHGKGGAVNVVTRSGSSQLHGGLYEYFSNNSLNATDRYALGNQLFGKRNQFGFNLGGNVPRTKLFYFTNLEIADGHGQRLNRITNPLLTDSTGLSVDSSSCTATAVQCASAARFIQNQMNVLVPRAERNISGLARLDYRRSDRNTFNLSVFATQARSPLGLQSQAVSSNGGLLDNGTAKQDTQYARLEWISAPTASSTNEMRLGVFQDRVATLPTASSLSTGGIGINLLGSSIGASNQDSGIMRERRYQFIDNFRVSVGAHTIMFGADVTRTRDWIDTLPNAKGTYYYNSLTSFAQDLASGAGKNYTEFTQSRGLSLRRLPSSEFGMYAQDIWKVTPNLQITGGLRYSKQFIPKPTAWDASYYQTRQIKSPSYNADPRIGFALKANERTVIRASFGLYHSMQSGELLDALFTGNGAYQPSILAYPTQSGSPYFPNSLTARTAPSGTGNLMYESGKPSNPYTRQATLSLEKALGGGFTMNLGYVGSRGLKLRTAEEVNIATTTKKVTYTILDEDGSKSGTYSPYFYRYRLDTTRAHVYEVTNGGSSWYNAMVAELSKKMTHGFTAHISYTWAHAIDDVGSPLVVGGLPVGSSANDFRADQGNSANDQRHRAVIDWTWQPRVIKSESAAARFLLNGWELSSVTTLASPLPATAMAIVLGQQFSGVPSAFANSLTGAGGWSRVPFLPVNSLRGDNEYSVNARLARPLPFTERFTGRLVFEAYNLLNTQFNTNVNTAAYTVTNGIFTPIASAGTGNATRGYITGSNARSLQVSFRLNF